MADIDNLFDDDYGYEPIEEQGVNDVQDDYVQQTSQPVEEGDLIESLLKRQGINDPTRIKFEGEDGIIKERDWDELSYNEQLNILTSDSSSNPEIDLDDDEIDLINTIRSSKISPAEYLDAVKNQAINDYASKETHQEPRYSVDDYTDDELFIYDMQARMPDMTDDELREALENAKSNETVYQKQVNGIRNEYKQLENNKFQQEQAIAQQEYQQQYQQYANAIIDAIDNQSDIAGIFELEDEDKQLLAYSILGQDQAGISNLAKAVNDPTTLVKMMWFALNGERAFQEIDEYYKDQITKARQSGYEKGKQEASGETNSRVVQKPRLRQKQYKTIDDLD